MPTVKIEKNTGLQNLSTFQVFIQDTAPTSKAFALSELPDILTIGRNGFLANGSAYLAADTPVLVEVLDSAGNPVYCSPIKNYVEGLARFVSIEIYSDTAPGLGSITILGHLRTDFSGNPIPEKWARSYNVKWTKQIQIDPFKTNTTPIRLYQRPTLDVSEIFNDAREITGSITNHIGTGSVVGKSLLPFTGSFQQVYGILFAENNLIKEMVSGTFSAVINGAQYTTSIGQVANSNLLFATTPFSTNGIPQNFSITNYSFSYPTPPTYSFSPVKDAYAQLTLSNLRTFSGDLRRVKLFVKPVDVDIDYYLISDTVLQATDLLVKPARGELEFNYGYIADQGVIDAFWTPINETGWITANGQYTFNGCVLASAMLGPCPPITPTLPIISDGTWFADGTVLGDDTLAGAGIFADGEFFAEGDIFGDGG